MRFLDNSTQKLSLVDIDAIRLLNIDNRRFLLIRKVNKWYFIEIPLNISFDINHDDKVLVFLNSDSKKAFIPTFNLLKSMEKKLFVTGTRKLKINGLGYRCFLEDDNKTLVLKVGHSHKVDMKVPSFIKTFKISKESVRFVSDDRILSGNFLQQAYIKRPADCYKKRGLIKQRMRIRIKPIRKK